MTRLRHRLFTGLIAIVVAGCTGPSVHKTVHLSYPELDPDCCPWLIERDDPAPAGARIVAEIGYGEAGFSKKCSFEENRERLRIDACRLGADAVKIVAENHPNFNSTCYRVRAVLFRLDTGLESEPRTNTIADADRGKCPSVLTRRYRDTPPTSEPASAMEKQ